MVRKAHTRSSRSALERLVEPRETGAAGVFRTLDVERLERDPSRKRDSDALN